MVSFSHIIFCITLLINPISCYIPETRMAHNSVIVHGRLLIFGGWRYSNSTNSTNSTNLTNSTKIYSTSEMFSLDLSTAFQGIETQWDLVLEGNLPVYEYLSTALVSTIDQDIIYLIGGFMTGTGITTEEYDYSNLVYTYDYSSTEWSPVKVNNVHPRQEITGVIDDKGIIYFFGGNNETNYNYMEPEGRLFNDMQIFDVSSTVWSKLNINDNLPLPCSAYTANLLTNGIIVYLGGYETSDSGNFTSFSNLTLSSMNTIKLFDTKKSEWSQMNVTGGDTIKPRIYHSSVLSPDGNIILFGGVGAYNKTVHPKLALLDIKKNIYEWTIPSSYYNSPPLLFGHSANIYENYMIITFGFDKDNLVMNSQIYFFHIYAHTWSDGFFPKYSPYIPDEPENTEFSNDLSPITLDVGLGIGGFIILVFVSMGIIFLKDRKKKRATHPI
ncbi:hypothetical protein Glove_606g73 [Diversispora epigaea]|uniref:Attractin/MKLN-like beta-propeller domain-containing protein n=1 Tax=Diversispora epigaea TaxID=1348612 RepID=A0A397GD43_9GLOM|nr:hypothetical protein Glove_606g73 [Diversispora epigaea]